MLSIPINVVPYMLGSIATLVVGVRSAQKYKQLHTPLLRHFAISGFLASAGMGLLSVAYILPLDEYSIKVFLMIGRACLDIVAYLQVYLIWYLTPLKKRSVWWLVGPLIPIALVGYFFQVKAYLENFTGVVDNVAVFVVPKITSYTHAFSLLIVFCAGLVIFKNAFDQTETKARLRLISVGLLYTVASISDLYNTFFAAGQSNSWIVLVGFAIASGVFLISTLLLFKKDKKVVETLNAK